MLCPSCGADIANDSYYCAECGAQLDEKAFSAQNVEPVSSGSQSGGYSSGYADPSDDSQPLGLMDSITRPFKDPGWILKALIAAAFGLIPILGQLVGMIFVVGIQVEYIRKILRRDNPNVLPEWNDWGAIFGSGLILWIIDLIYLLGINFLCGLSFVPFFGVIFSMWNDLQSSSPETIAGIIFGTLAIPLLISTTILSIFSMFAFLIPIFYARNGNFADAFDLGTMLKMIMKDMGNFIIITLVLFGISLGIGLFVGGFITVLSLLLSIIPILGSIMAWVISSVVSQGIAYVSMMMTSSALTEFYIKNRAVAEGE